ncbi:MAG TPA: BTAD domain-containing putative transcriptional regulator [Acidimicrobiales bacterium]|jgi:DNA-binding SARP family transcriptional activator|nr:BTAD domain-containing putative transcriptional regulator [Acidimicrobiales bacterium]
MTRAQVAGTLWPESSDQRAGASLRTAVSRLESPVRNALKVTALDLSLHEEVLVDFQESKALARRLINREAPWGAADLQGGAMALLSRDLLPGWYDNWAILAAEDWRQLRVHALEAAAARLTEADRAAEAADAASAAVRAEPLRESARAELIRAHMAQGNQAEALAEFQRYSWLLRIELGLTPTPRISQLVAGLQSR